MFVVLPFETPLLGLTAIDHGPVVWIGPDIHTLIMFLRLANGKTFFFASLRGSMLEMCSSHNMRPRTPVMIRDSEQIWWSYRAAGINRIPDTDGMLRRGT